MAFLLFRSQNLIHESRVYANLVSFWVPDLLQRNTVIVPQICDVGACSGLRDSKPLRYLIVSMEAVVDKHCKYFPVPASNVAKLSTLCAQLLTAHSPTERVLRKLRRLLSFCSKNRLLGRLGS